MSDIRHWLVGHGFGQFADAFEQNRVDLDIVRDLSEQDLRDLGVSALGDRKLLLRAIAAFKEMGQVESANASPAQVVVPPQDGERRQLTVMFCDLVGSTALSERIDPEVLRALLHEYRTVCGEVIARYEGFVARYVGDGILTYFGWPKAHEEDAERALRAALEIVQAVKRASSSEPLSVRIGIATGPVVVGEQAGEGDQSKLAIGATPNLAARLQGLALADQVVVASSTRRLVGNAFELIDLGEHELKGISEPVHAWRVVAVSAAASRFDAATLGAITPMVGREQELGLLLDRWRQAQEGEGQVVLLSGESGIGKSRLMSTLRERLEIQGVQSLRFQCSPYHVNSAFYPSIDNFERALKFNRDDTAQAKLDKLETLIVTQLGRPVTDVRFIAAILSIPYEQRYGALPMTPQKFKDETLRTLVDLSEASARKQPRVMLFEDAHWADPTSLEVLDLLIDRVKTIPLLIVLTHRPEFQSRWSQQGHVTALNLSKLTRTQSTAIIDKLIRGKELPTGLLDQIVNKTDGVPLYVEELTKSILESGELKDLGDHYDYQGTERRVTIPATLRDSLTARLDRSPPAKEIAQIGSAIGREFSYELIAAVAPHSPERLDQALAQLTESGLAFRRGTPPEALYTFKHALVQDAAYDSLLKSRRQTLHTKIARAIEERLPDVRETEPEMLARHYDRAGMPKEAATLWHKAGSMALARSTLPDAIAHLTHGLEACERIAEGAEEEKSRLELLTTRGIAYMAMRGWPAPEVGENLSEALPLARTHSRVDLLVPILAGLFWNKHNPGPVRASLQLVDEVFDESRSRNDRDLELLAHMLAVSAHFWIGNLTDVVTHTDRVAQIYEPERGRRIQAMLSHDPKTVTQAHCTMALWMLGYPDRALRMFEENNEHARRLGNYFDHGFALSFGGIMLGFRRDVERCNSIVDRVIRMAREQRLPVLEHLMATWMKADALYHSGQKQEQMLQRRAYMDAWMSVGGGVSLPYQRSLCADTLAELGCENEALDLLAQALEQIERPDWGERVHLAEILRIKGTVLGRKGDMAGAERSYRTSLEWAREQQAKSWELRTAISLARLWQSQGKCKEAHDLLASTYNWFTEGFDTKDLIEAKALLQELGSS